MEKVHVLIHAVNEHTIRKYMDILKLSASQLAKVNRLRSLGDEKIAAFTLVNHNQSDSQTEFADWQLGNLEFFIQYNESYMLYNLKLY